MNIIFNSFPLPWPSFRHARHFPSSCPSRPPSCPALPFVMPGCDRASPLPGTDHARFCPSLCTLSPFRSSPYTFSASSVRTQYRWVLDVHVFGLQCARSVPLGRVRRRGCRGPEESWPCEKTCLFGVVSQETYIFFNGKT